MNSPNAGSRRTARHRRKTEIRGRYHHGVATPQSRAARAPETQAEPSRRSKLAPRCRPLPASGRAARLWPAASLGADRRRLSGRPRHPIDAGRPAETAGRPTRLHRRADEALGLRISEFVEAQLAGERRITLGVRVAPEPEVQNAEPVRDDRASGSISWARRACVRAASM